MILIYACQMGSLALCSRTGGKWRSWSRRESPSCRMIRVQKLAPTCRSVGSAGWSAARKGRSPPTPPSSVASTISDGKALTLWTVILLLYLCHTCWDLPEVIRPGHVDVVVSSVVIKSLFEAGCLGVRQFNPSWLTRVRLSQLFVTSGLFVLLFETKTCFSVRVKSGTLMLDSE